MFLLEKEINTMTMFQKALSVAALIASMCGVSLAAHAVNPPEVASPLDLKVKDIDGNEVDLSMYKGSVVLIVNVASKCGLTPQYEGLEALYQKHKGRGLVVLGFPANNFMGQEPGSETEIKQFCSTKYNVTFPMFSKISVKGDDIAPLYAWLTSEKTNPEFSGDIEWNFGKFLVNHEGKVVKRFSPRTKPDSEELGKAVEAALAGKEAAAKAK